MPIGSTKISNLIKRLCLTATNRQTAPFDQTHQPAKVRQGAEETLYLSYHIDIQVFELSVNFYYDAEVLDKNR